MDRRSFVQKASLGFTALSFFPLASRAKDSAPLYKLVLDKSEEQIRHGALALPQVHEALFESPFSWLGELKRNLFFGKGFQVETSETDIEIISFLFKNPNDGNIIPVQIQLDGKGYLVLFEEEEYRSSPKTGLHTIAKNSFHNVEIQTGSWSETFEEVWNCSGDEEYFLFNLAGACNVNDTALLTNEGLAWSGKNTIQVSGNAVEFLMIKTITDKI